MHASLHYCLSALSSPSDLHAHLISIMKHSTENQVSVSVTFKHMLLPYYFLYTPQREWLFFIYSSFSHSLQIHSKNRKFYYFTSFYSSHVCVCDCVCESIIFCLPIHLFLDTWVLSRFGLLWIMLQIERSKNLSSLFPS